MRLYPKSCTFRPQAWVTAIFKIKYLYMEGIVGSLYSNCY